MANARSLIPWYHAGVGPVTTELERYMALVIPDDHYLAGFHHSQAGTTHPAVCTLGVHYVGEEVDFLSNSALLGGAWTGIMAKVCTPVTYNRFTLASQEGIVRDIGVSVVGGNTNGCASYNCAYLVKKTTLLPGRKHVGRMYIPGAEETNVDQAGFMFGSIRADIQAAFDAFLTEVLARDFQPVILHNQKPGDPPPEAPTNIDALVVEAQIATMRRRMRG